MTKEITKAIILQEIRDKFKLREFDPAAFLFDETVVPVYEIKNHLIHGYSDYTTVSIGSAASFVFFTVPSDEVWHLLGYNVIFMAAGAYTVAGLYISRNDRTIGAFVYLDLTAAQTVSYAINLPKEVRLTPGDRLLINVDGYTSTADLRLHIDILKEEIR